MSRPLVTRIDGNLCGRKFDVKFVENDAAKLLASVIPVAFVSQISQIRCKNKNSEVNTMCEILHKEIKSK